LISGSVIVSDMGAKRSPGIQVRLAVDAAESCPVAAASEGDATARNVSWSRAADDGPVVEEFELVGDGEDHDLPSGGSVVFGTDDTERVRFTRDGTDCICDVVERCGAPVTDVRATRGSLHLTFHATDVETVRSVVDDLKQTFGSVRIDRLARTDGEDPEDLVVVDRGQLTERQQEVLETAMEMGYFQRPRDANGTRVAEELGISPSTFAEHLASAQAKVLDSLLEGTG
jgi:predicted DNA binding protein